MEHIVIDCATGQPAGASNRIAESVAIAQNDISSEIQREAAEEAARLAQRAADVRAVLKSPLLANDPAGRAALARLLGGAS